MKIDFSQMNVISSNVEKNIQDPGVVKSTQQNRGYKLDISGIVKDNAVFASYGKDGQGMTWNEYLQDNGISDSSISGNSAFNLRRNYMAVMSNSLSTEDFAELQKEGYKPGSMEIKDAVNVVDQIKVKLIEAGVNIKGYTDTVDSDVIEQIAGSKSLAQTISSKLEENDLPVSVENVRDIIGAFEMAETISDNSKDSHLDENALKALISNNLEPTINNVFLSMYQSGNYSAQKAESDFDTIRDQIEKVIEKSNQTVNDESISNAKWLYLNDLPITEDTLSKLTTLKEIVFPLENERLLDNMSDAISLGMSAKDASLITNRRILMEVRLSMTTEANRKLLQSNYSIDTSDMEKEVEELKSLEEKAQNRIYSDNSSADLFELTNQRVSEIKELPLMVVADFRNKADFTINDIYEKGNSLKADFAKASESYEALRTEIRKDLGDNIKNAFRNAGEMLKEMNLSASEANKRAVRILGYNQMEISSENISSVKMADQQISRLIDRMTPGNVLRLIREGINPLNKSVNELNNTLDNYGNDDRNEKYSEFLVKLEHNNQISEQERESFIGIYRLINQVETDDGAAIGTVINSGAELSIKNLLSAVRSRKNSGIDVSINDSFGILDDLPIDETKIDVQISQAFGEQDFYKKETSDLLGVLNPEKLRTMWEEGKLNASTVLDELYDKMMEPATEAEEEIDRAFYEETAQEYRNNVNSEKEVIDLLNNYDIPMTADNLAAATQILNNRGAAFKQLLNLSDKIKEEDLSKKAKGLFDTLKDLSDEETMQEVYENLANTTKTMLEKEIGDSAMNAEEFRRMTLLSKQFVVMAKLSKEESYEVPVETAGGITSVNLKIIKGSDESKVVATMNIPDIGDLVAHMLVGDEKVSGYLMAETDEGIEFLNEIKEKLDKELGTDFSVSKKSNLEINRRVSEKEAKAEKTETTKLYRMAKSFIQAVSEREVS